jgi:beta-lactamase class A
VITRRDALKWTLTAVAALAARPEPARAAAALETALADLEVRLGGRLGVAVLDPDRRTHIGRRQDERFPMCSTFKALAVSHVLARVDRGEEQLDRRVIVHPRDLVGGSITEKRIGGSGMTIAELCEAALTVSDNTAANLLLSTVGGPAALTAFLRSIGDEVTRLDRIEPALNEAIPGDPRDTTTPAAMVETLRGLVLGTTLSDESRARLTAWLVANKTGNARIRAGVPRTWRVADKTGTGNHGSTNDIAVLWPPSREPIVLAIYFTQVSAKPADCDRVVADAARLVSATFQ